MNRRDIELNKYYTLSGEDTKEYGNYRTRTLYDNDSYHTNNSSGYVLFTRFDEQIASGVFKFSAYNPASAKMEITEGYFDIKN